MYWGKSQLFWNHAVFHLPYPITFKCWTTASPYRCKSSFGNKNDLLIHRKRMWSVYYIQKWCVTYKPRADVAVCGWLGRFSRFSRTYNAFDDSLLTALFDVDARKLSKATIAQALMVSRLRQRKIRSNNPLWLLVERLQLSAIFMICRLSVVCDASVSWRKASITQFSLNTSQMSWLLAW